MLLKFLSTVIYLPMIIFGMIISQIYFAKQYDD